MFYALVMFPPNHLSTMLERQAAGVFAHIFQELTRLSAMDEQLSGEQRDQVWHEALVTAFGPGHLVTGTVTYVMWLC